ncbi:hypothetical protein ACFXJ5_39790 [Streptomyces sp. NPDC059373]
MIRICAVTALLTASVLTGWPANAAVGPAPVPTTCTVNDVSVTSTTITGTAGVDDIECENGVNAGTTITGLGNTDLITVDGVNAGTIDGGDGADLIDVDGGNAATGSILGGAGTDIIFVTAEDDESGTANSGTVDGQADSDVCLFDPAPSGTTHCEVVV